MALRSFLTRSSLLKQNVSKSSVRMVPSMNFHAGLPRREEEKASEVVAKPQERGILTDWKILAPIAVAIAIPTLENGIYVINEETQLACCFMLFCTSVYKFGGDAIASFFDEKSEALLKEHNLLEDKNIEVAKKLLSTHHQHLDVVDDMTAVYGAYQDVIRKMCQVESHKLRHDVRDVFQRNLDTIVSYEATYFQKLQEEMVAYATKKVLETIQQSGKSLKENSLKEAFADLATIHSEDSAKDDEKKDEIAALFIKYLHEYGDVLEKKTGTTIKLSPAEIADLQAELDVYLKRVNMEEAAFKAPSEVTFELIK